ncbi:MAG TPA: DNA polymerase III subunit delta [Acidimicrobiales bacterium]|nr:DNA polymerase III subunit delta [Acidimicrobiales bacterium]
MSTAADPKPVYLIRGDDVVLLSEATRALVATLVVAEDAGLAVEEIDLEALDDHGLGALLDACLTPPFLTDRRVVVARNAGVLNAEDAARVVQYLDDPLDTTVLVLIGGGGTIPPKLVAAIKKVGEHVDAGAPRQARERTSWLVERLRKAPVKLDNKAAQKLGEHLGEDVSRLSGILDVLAAAYGEGANVDVEQLEPYLGEAGGMAPWDLTDAIDKGDAPTALELLHRLMKGGDRHPLVVLATLHRHFGQMLRLDGSGARDEADAAATLGLTGSSFPAKKALAQGRRLGGPKIQRAIALLAEADLDLRGQKAWPEDLVMEVLIARLCQLSRV